MKAAEVSWYAGRYGGSRSEDAMTLDGEQCRSEPASACRDREQRFSACQTQSAKGVTPTGCFAQPGPDGKLTAVRIGMPAMSAYPATLHDCASARATFKELLATDLAKGDPRTRREAQVAASFIDRACKDRGHYTWKGDRFVHDATPAATSTSFTTSAPPPPAPR